VKFVGRVKSCCFIVAEGSEVHDGGVVVRSGPQVEMLVPDLCLVFKVHFHFTSPLTFRLRISSFSLKMKQKSKFEDA
jgi:hypothetical protein